MRELGLLALVAGCAVETTYLPKTPGALALGMKQGEPIVYKNGIEATLVSAPPLTACSAAATFDVAEAATHFARYKSNIQIASVFYALSGLMPPLVGGGIVFGARANEHQQQSYVHVVDAINKHNDDARCLQ